MCRTLALLLSLVTLSAHAQYGPQLHREIAASLVVVEGTRTRAFRWPREPEFILLYFGADWCDHCHALLPTLIATRNALRAAGLDTEVVYVSQDSSESQMRHYLHAQAMPWPALDYRRIETLPALRRLAGQAPPNLVLLDRDGKVRASAWQGRRYLGPVEVLQRWLELAHDEAVTTGEGAKRVPAR